MLAMPGATATGLAIRVQRVSRVFDGGVAALRDADLDVPAGQFVAMIGPSGCGKSTLLRLIARLDRVTTGDISVTGQGDIAFVFQDPHLMPWRNVLRNVRSVLAIQFLTAAQALDFHALKPGKGVDAARWALRERIPHLARDRYLAHDIQVADEMLRSGELLAAAEKAAGRLASF